MKPFLIAILFGLSALPAAAFAQGAQLTAAVESAAPAASPTRPATEARSITRQQYVDRAQERAGQRATSRFDQMDADHDGVLDRAEIRAWRSQHPRRAAAQPSQAAPQ
jgi:hypothetical protein